MRRSVHEVFLSCGCIFYLCSVFSCTSPSVADDDIIIEFDEMMISS